MKKITCEMCGSSELVKKDGYFECQSCGLKYSPEELKKIMIEGTVEVAGKVKIDSEEKLDNFYELARRAKDEENSDSAERYYSIILEENPSDWEAVFYSIYYKTKNCRIGEISLAARSFSNSLTNTYYLIKKEISDREELGSILHEISFRCTDITKLLSNAAYNHYAGIDQSIRNKHKDELIANVNAASEISYVGGDGMLDLFGEDEVIKEYALGLLITGVNNDKELNRFFYNSDYIMNKSRIEKYEKIIGLSDKSHKDDIVTNYENRIKMNNDNISRTKTYKDELEKKHSNLIIRISIPIIITLLVCVFVQKAFVNLHSTHVRLPICIVVIIVGCLNVKKMINNQESLEKRINSLDDEINNKEEENEKLKRDIEEISNQ